ncbi:lytic transglycosylase domain-containing protein [Paratractidigestivibacter sp.]|uniref:lytic transglycosylase domain-containing protein n=1 Tax=Paratractidigestivibacter sp. TaxID=2847316 RepID=UPI002AC96DA3|nr:lytic transglycosylase domain-containing protein [Paratractidigestivibacter sp.]
MASKKDPTRFLRWFRVLPMLVLVIALAASATLAASPTTLVAQVFYPVKYAEQIEESSARHGVDPLLVAAVAKCESNWNEAAESGAGAVGLMQVMPTTAAELAERGLVDGAAYDAGDLTDGAVNIEYGCAYLGILQNELSSEDEVICAYNAGLGAVQKWLEECGSVPENVGYSETKYYFERVKAAYEGYQKSYPNGLTLRAGTE